MITEAEKIRVEVITKIKGPDASLPLRRFASTAVRSAES